MIPATITISSLYTVCLYKGLTTLLSAFLQLDDLCQVPDSLQQEPAAKRRKLSDEEDTVEGEGEVEVEEEEGDKLEARVS